jgi:hypothetical protein
VQVTNFAQATTVGFLQSALVAFNPVSNLRLLVDNDGVDWTDATVYSSATLVGGRVEFAGVSFTSTQPYFTLATTNYGMTPLPVELISFQGRTIGEENLLTWSTATEHNNDHFDVERSADGAEFEWIGTMDGAGNSQQVINYELNDRQPLRGYNYYRLKQVDIDGTATYSNVVALFNRGPGAECTVRTLGPDGLYALWCSVEEGATLELFGPTGQPLQVAKFGADRSQEVDLRAFASGFYFARITDGENVKTYKLLRP